MVANSVLAKQRELSEEDIVNITSIHEKLYYIIEKRVGMGFNQAVYNEIEKLENSLQGHWGFTIDPSYHTWKKSYKFKCQWANRTFKCLDTGVLFTIPEFVKERDFFSIGAGGIDVGRLDCYSRVIGNLEEVV
jgi:hypothetical protein